MPGPHTSSSLKTASALAGRMLLDNRGNAIWLIAAAILPLMALVGGGVDMGRSYLAQTRLQQACDAGVLAARKKLGSAIALTGTPPENVRTVGDQFFNQNFRDGSYATKNRSFAMTLEPDYSISGIAQVDVPTTIMGAFGYKNVALKVNCEAKLNFSNTDIMFALDTTGSMSEKNSGDTETRMDAMKRVVKEFYAQVEGAKSPGTRVRYGFLPYSTNVRVADILKSDWMVDKWTYQTRVPNPPTANNVSFYYVSNTVMSGTKNNTNYPNGTSCPADTKTEIYGPTIEVSTSPHEYYYDSTTNGVDYNCVNNDGVFTISGIVYDNYVQRTTWKYAYDGTYYSYTYKYAPKEYDVTSLKGASGQDAPVYGSIKAEIEGNTFSSAPNPYDIYNTGCIEERETYEITDWSNVDLAKALDLDIDLVPSPNQPRTQWRPMLPELVFERTIDWQGQGNFSVSAVDSSAYYLNPAWAGIYDCPAAARKLGEMNATDVQAYLDTLTPAGDTYHDIGMIWAGRMLSSTGLFATENADVPGKPTARNLIFLTDGQTETLDINYGAYGIDGLDQRRWRSKAASGIDLDEVVEKRFGVACEEVKKRNITVWVIGFGTSLNPIMTNCAGPGHYFEAQNAGELSTIFSTIAAQMGDLRISK